MGRESCGGVMRGREESVVWGGEGKGDVWRREGKAV